MTDIVPPQGAPSRPVWRIRNMYDFGNNRPNRTTDVEKNVTPKPDFRIWFSPYGCFWGKNCRTVFGTIFSTEKVTFIFVIGRPPFQPYHLLSPLAPLHGEIGICPCDFFVWNSMPKNFYFEAFFGIVCIFSSILPKSECNFLFLNKNIKHIIIVYHPSSQLAGKWRLSLPV